MTRLLVILLLGLLMAAPEVYAETTIVDEFSVFGEVRARDEYWRDSDFNSDVGLDDHFATLRTTLGFKVRPVENVEAVVALRDWRFFGEEGVGAVPETSPKSYETNLYNAYIDWKFGDDRWGLKVGRQEVVLGTKRMFSNFDVYKGLYHDAAILSYMADDWSAHAFTAKWYEASSTGLEGGSDQNDRTGYGIHVTANFAEGRSLDGQLAGGKLNADGADDPFNDLTLFHLSGAWNDNSLDRIFYGFEGIAQFGTFETTEQDLMAGALHAHFGLKLAEDKHRLWISVNMASGNDDDPEESEEFIQLFGDNNNQIGMMDYVALRNILHGGLRYRGLFIEERLYVELGLHYFSLYSADGDLYFIDGLTGQASAGGNGNGEDTSLGIEFDTYLAYSINEALTFDAMLGVFSPTDYFKKANGDNGDPAILMTIGGTLRF